MENGVGPVLRATQRFAIASGRGPLLGAWRQLYRLVAVATGRALTRDVPGAAVYLRAGGARRDVVPGVSDIDLVVVLPDDPVEPGAAATRVRTRFGRAARRVPGLGGLVDAPSAYEDAELAACAGRSYATFGLDATPPRAAYVPDDGLLDRRRVLERPGLGADADWVLLRGRDRRPVHGGRDLGAELVAAWLELSFWWRVGLEGMLAPARPHVPHLCVKLVVEPARIWLRVAQGRRVDDADAVLDALEDALPEEAEAVARTRALRRALPSLPVPPLADAVGALARLSERTASVVHERARGAGEQAVALLGDPSALIGPVHLAPAALPPGDHPPGALALCDWRALAVPTHADESLLPAVGSPGDPAALTMVARATRAGAHRVLVGDAIVAFPVPTRDRPMPRNVACRASDPVTFAVLDGAGFAHFPLCSGWSVEHTAARAVAEQRARLAGSRPGSARLLAAARAGLLHASLTEAPALPLTLTATAEALGRRSSRAERLAASALETVAAGETGTPALLRELSALVRALPGLATD